MPSTKASTAEISPTAPSAIAARVAGPASRRALRLARPRPTSMWRSPIPPTATSFAASHGVSQAATKTSAVPVATVKTAAGETTSS
ncbi:hypothetical protein [Salinarimonas sp.]|uniref:hypothetical protein n=1 Tax=Salinarimonas sp. TaxID=2766526 RepID=UPI0032D99AA5